MDIKGAAITRQTTLQGYLLNEMKADSHIHNHNTILSPRSQEENVSELLLDNKRA